MKTAIQTLFVRLGIAAGLVSLGLVASVLYVLPSDLLTMKAAPVLVEVIPELATSRATSAVAFVDAFLSSQGVGRECVSGVETRPAPRSPRRFRTGPDQVTQTIDGELVSCRWPAKPRLFCGNGMSDYESFAWSHYVDLVDWSPQVWVDPDARSFTSPHDFLKKNEHLGLGRDARVAILVHLFVTRDRPWDIDLYEATDHELLWWIGSTTGVWWRTEDENTLLLGRTGSEDYVIWDTKTQRVYSP